MYNLVGTAVDDGRILLSMIDFERSRTLRRNPTIESARVEPGRLWPTAELGTLLRRTRPSMPPADMIRRIQAITRMRIEGILRAVAEELPFVDWCDNSIDVLGNRAERIRVLLEEVWRAN
jgi:hypothetical protein